jgi:hypothetical protein
MIRWLLTEAMVQGVAQVWRNSRRRRRCQWKHWIQWTKETNSSSNGHDASVRILSSLLIFLPSCTISFTGQIWVIDEPMKPISNHVNLNISEGYWKELIIFLLHIGAERCIAEDLLKPFGCLWLIMFQVFIHYMALNKSLVSLNATILLIYYYSNRPTVF